VTYQLTIASGKSNVVAPNGIRYQAGATIVLPDTAYAQLSASAGAADFTGVTYLGDGMTYQCTLKSTVGNVVLPNQIRYGASAVAILSDAEYSQLSLSAISVLFSAVTTLGGGGGISPPAGDIGGSASSPTVVSTHLTSPLPIAQGGSGAATAAQDAVFAGPASGGSGAPSFRSLVAADLPAATTLAQGALKLPAASLGASPAAPASTTSTTLVMAGLAETITPANTGKVLVILSGSATNSTTGINGTVGARYGTGTPPANGAAVTGTRFGGVADQGVHNGSVSAGSAFIFQQVLTLTANTTYWFDLCQSTASNTASLPAVAVSLVELPS
jgi:hypothetical protein